MSEEKQQPNFKRSQDSNGTNREINHDILKWIIIGLVCFAAAVLIFGIGMFVGGTKARFSYRWAESYHKNFGGPRGGFLNDWRKGSPPSVDFIEGHGAFGEIIKINDSDLIIRDRGNVEKIIIITENTALTKRGETIKKDKLNVGDYAVVIGSPNDKGQIEAKFIRLFSGESAKILPKPFLRPLFK